MSELIQKKRWIAWLSLIVCAGLWIWLLAFLPIYTAIMGGAVPLLAWLRAVWTGIPDMEHGPFLPLVSMYVIVLRRKAIIASMGGPDWRGGALVLAGAFLFLVGVNMEEVRFCVAALVFWIWAIPFAIWGAGVARQLVFPAGYLLLSIPRWELVAIFTLKLRLLAAAVAVGIANGIGIATERIGTGLHSAAGGGFNLDVAEPCSGLRSLFAMTALAAAYAFFTQQGLWRKWALFACAAPVAVISNITRIVTITLVAAWFGEKKAIGFYHDYSGYIIFLMAVLLLVEVGRLIGRWRLPKWAVKTQVPSGAPVAWPPLRSLGIRGALLVLSPLILLACGLIVRLEPPVRLGSVDFLPAALPTEIGAWQGSPVWHCHNEQCMSTFTEDELNTKGISPLPADPAFASPHEPWVALRDIRPRYRCPACETGELYAAALGEKLLLSADTCVLRSRYTGGGTASFTVTLVISGFSRNSLHNPHLCLAAQGITMNRIDTKIIPAGAANSISVTALNLERDEKNSSRMSRWSYVYWFFTKDRQTSSVLIRMFWSAWARGFHHRSDRWVMVTILSDRALTSGTSDDTDLLTFSGAVMEKLRAADRTKRSVEPFTPLQ